jgi:mRNA (2'-O-methyladenosine-N6-)-methyltransferase
MSKLPICWWFRLYEIIERLVPGGRKVEIFARKHNIRPGWLSVGNQLDTTKLIDTKMIEKFEQDELLKLDN